jgi:NDP-sugar pyrophosphorylase family protein
MIGQLFDLFPFEHRALFQTIQYPWEALGKALENYILQTIKPKIRGEVDSRVFLLNEAQIEIGEGSVVEPGAYIKGPVIIGKNCVIRHGAYLRGNILVGDHCVLGHDTEVKGSIFLNKAKAAHFNYVGDSILGNSVNLGAGTKLANLKVMAGSITVTSESGEKVDTGLRKLGAILGDQVETGCNAVCAPGTIVGKRSVIYANETARGFIPHNSIFDGRAIRPRK